MPRDLNKPVNEYLKFFDQYNRTTVFIILVVICAFFAVDSFFRSGRAVDISNAAKAKIDYDLPRMQDEIDQTRIRNDLYSIYIQELYVELKNQGFDPPPLPENE